MGKDDWVKRGRVEGMKRDYIYLTALTNERYIPGLMALVRSMKEVKTQYDMAIMIPESREKELKEKISDYGIQKIGGVFIITQPDINIPLDVDIPDYYWKDTFFKLQAARCFEYKKIILLDRDQMAVRNIDHLFEKKHLTSTTCGRCVHPDWRSLSSGLLVIEPLEEFYNKLIACIKPAVERKRTRGLNVGDQDVFQEVYPEWRNDDTLYITENYNICWGWIENLCKKEGYDVNDFYMIHFPGKEKPWDNKKYYYWIILLNYLLKGKTNKLFYKIKIWKKYRRFCEKV